MNGPNAQDDAPEDANEFFKRALENMKELQKQIENDVAKAVAGGDVAGQVQPLSPMHHAAGGDRYDIFLSYRSVDHCQCKPLKTRLEELDFRVYWDRDDPVLKDKPVTKETAEHLRNRMRRCRALVFAVSSHAGESRWMPWELGFFDGRTGRVFVYPLDEGVLEHNTGQQYLDFYPLIDVDNIKEWLEQHLPHEEPALPWGEPAGPEMTEDYGEWFNRNWARIAADPAFAMELWGNLWQAWFRLLAAAKDRQE